MKLDALKHIVAALNKAEVEYLLVGGLAVVAHGYGRMTHDIDLVINFDSSHLRHAFNALTEIGYKPRVPVTVEQFSDSETRKSWIEEKGMTVLNFYNDEMPHSPVDLFVEEPFDFDQVYLKAHSESFDEGGHFKYVDIDTLISMKKKAGRAKDLDDIENLEKLKNA